jgi:1,4-dihydroxy-2-naphthoyl-CoA synthase
MRTQRIALTNILYPNKDIFFKGEYCVMLKKLFSSLEGKDVVVAIVALIGAASGIYAATTTYWNKNRELSLEYASKDRETNIQMLRIALDILREDPKQSKIAAVRGWAVDIINHSSPVPISEDARAQLINSKVDFGFVGGGYYDVGGYDPYSKKGKSGSKSRP